MRNKLSEKQASVIRIMLSGWLYHKPDGTLHLEDADKNSYYIRQATVKTLLDKGYITMSYTSANGCRNYTITKEGLSYLEANHKDEHDDFTG